MNLDALYSKLLVKTNAKLALIVILIVGVLVMLGIKALFGKKAALIFSHRIGLSRGDVGWIVARLDKSAVQAQRKAIVLVEVEVSGIR